MRIGKQYVSSFERHGRMLAAATGDVTPRKEEVSLWNVDGTRIREFPLRVPGHAHVFNLEVGLVAYLEGDSTICLYDLGEGRLIKRGPKLTLYRSGYWPCMSKDGEWVCMHDTVWNRRTDRSYRIPGQVAGFLTDRRLVSVETVSGFVGLDHPGNSPIPGWLQTTPVVRRMYFAMCVSDRCRLVVHDVDSRRVVASSPWRGKLSIFGAPNGGRLAVYSRDGKRPYTVTIWDDEGPTVASARKKENSRQSPH